MRKNWKKKIDMLLSFVIILILLPLFATTIGQSMQLEELIYGKTVMGGGAQKPLFAPQETEEAVVGVEAQKTEEAAVGTVAQETEEAAEIETQEIEEAVVGTVAREIGVTAERQAILAQCVVARTNIYDARVRGTAEPEALDIEGMQKLWGADFKQMYDRMAECVTLTENEVLLWEGDYAYAAYHAISAGRTRDMKEIYEKADMPYLTEQLCQADVTALGYLSVSYLDKEAFLEECRRLFPESALDGMAGIEVHSRDAAGYVGEIKVGEMTVSGEVFRKSFGWNSACFSISELDGQVRIVTKGLGHGFGLSQNTAAAMAAEGADYKEILGYFYPGTEIVKQKAEE